MARRTSQGVVDGGGTLPSGTSQPDLPPVEVWGKSTLDQRPPKSRSPNGEWSSTLPNLRRSAQLIRATRCRLGLQIGMLCQKLGDLRFNRLGQQRTRAAFSTPRLLAESPSTCQV